jgi:hypothetical protein
MLRLYELLTNGPRCADDLARGDAAVIGRYVLMPMRPKPSRAQSLDGALRKGLVLETTAREQYLRLSYFPRHRDDPFRQRIVESARYRGRSGACPHIIEH